MLTSEEAVMQKLIGRVISKAHWRAEAADHGRPHELVWPDGAALGIYGDCCSQAWFGEPDDVWSWPIETVVVAAWEPAPAGDYPQHVTDSASLILGLGGERRTVIQLFCSHNGYYGACLYWRDPS